MGLVADVVDGEGHVLGDAALDADVPEDELGSAAGEVEVGEADAAGGHEVAGAVEIVAGVQNLRGATLGVGVAGIG